MSPQISANTPHQKLFVGAEVLLESIFPRSRQLRENTNFQKLAKISRTSIGKFGQISHFERQYLVYSLKVL